MRALGDSNCARMSFWDALELELWPKNVFDIFTKNWLDSFSYITDVFGVPQALGTPPSDSL